MLNTDGNGNIESFDSNGFTVGGNQYYANNNGATQMTWAWKANGGTTSTNNDGNLTSTVQGPNTQDIFNSYMDRLRWFKNTTQHGLGATIPKMIITKIELITLLIGKYIIMQIHQLQKQI